MTVRPRTLVLAATACSLAATIAFARPQQAPGTGTSGAPASAPPAATPPAAAPAAKPADAPATPANLPEASSIIEQHITAIGGHKAIDAIESTHYKGSIDSMMGKMDLEVASRKPNMFLMRQGMANMGSQEIGSDGTIAWVISPQRPTPQILEGEMATNASEGADIQALVRLVDKRFKDFKVVAKEQFNGKDCWKVDMKHPSGQAMIGMFAVDGGLIQGLQIPMDTPQGPMNQAIIFTDWEKVGDVMVFKTMNMEQMGMSVVGKFADFEFNKTDASFFKAPEAVVKAAEEAKAAKAGAKPADPAAPTAPAAPAAPAAPPAAPATK